MKKQFKKFRKRSLSIVLALAILLSVAVVGIVPVSASVEFKNGTVVYFDNSNTNWDGVTIFYGSNYGNGHYTVVQDMDKINNTNLYKVTLTNNHTVNDGQGFLFATGSTYATGGINNLNILCLVKSRKEIIPKNPKNP